MFAATINNATTKNKTDLDALFRLIQQNDEVAFRSLYTHLSRQILAYCLSFSKDDDVARDLFHTVMLTVYEKRHTYKEENLFGWIFTIARNTCRTWELKSKRFEPLGANVDVADENESHLDEDEVAIVHKAILSLSEEFRSVILLYYYGEMSIREIAESQELSESLIKVRLFRARKKLEEQLKNIIRY
ncbi:MAG: RNA polymerase sigma factor [Ignavibacteria bacterium]|nr:RNA polymerase sigma factor [Ignavibacteria bacterium]